MSHYKVLIVGDSRVRYLRERLTRTSLNIRFTVKSLPGADLRGITLKALIEISYDDYHLIILAGGINNITRLFHRPSRHVVPRHYDPADLANITADEMRLALHRIQGITSTPVVMASLVGIRLVTYSPSYSDILYGLQPIIDMAINRLNCLIRGMNRLNNMMTVDLSSHVHRCVGRGGRYRTRYLHLYDGLHPGSRLLEIWAMRILNYCANVFPCLTPIQDRIYDYYGNSY